MNHMKRLLSIFLVWVIILTVFSGLSIASVCIDIVLIVILIAQTSVWISLRSLFRLPTGLALLEKFYLVL